ncbi:CAP10 [Geosmithia morbida]|uniref:CAP10 n=1 Tax=Geosmithia morbida TaxID=1094350 RepID=A0A9P4YQL4_9HYPO|nr:CAP10 [Geosmithia morbida]KAF4119979.1 CAP10 [Geosmithia morbida]
MKPISGLILGAHRLSSRFYTSAAFERPVYLTITALLITSIALRLRSATRDRRQDSLEPLSPADAITTSNGSSGSGGGNRWRDIVRRARPQFYTLVACLVLRTLLFGHVLWTSQCSRHGIEALLPACVVVVYYVAPHQTVRLPGAKPGLDHVTPKARGPPPSIVGYVVLAAAWAVSVGSALDASTIRTGTACPSGSVPWPPTPLLQLAMCALDATVVVYLWRVVRLGTAQGYDVSRFLSTTFATAAAATALVSSLPFIREPEMLYLLGVNLVEVRHVLLDAFFAAAVILCALALSGMVQPWTLSFIASGLGLVGSRIPDLGLNPLPPPLDADALTRTSWALAALSGALVFSSRPPDDARRASTSAFVHGGLRVAYLGLVTVCLVAAKLRPLNAVETTLPAAVNGLFRDAAHHADRWMEDASRSQSMADAVAEYRRRYGVLPPPNFDKWYDFARARRSPVIDTFDQIHYPDLDVGGLRIRRGVVEQSPHVPGTHRWMLDAMESMIAPFAEHLPDMDVVFNLGDECRMAIPFADKQRLLARAQETRAAMAQAQETSWRDKGRADWPTEWPAVHVSSSGGSGLSPHFTGNLRRQLYYGWIAPTCAPDAAAHATRWWDRGTACVRCQAPHSVLTDQGFVTGRDDTVDDLCHQPDLAYLSGFVAAPTSATTKRLLPIFSQSRVGGFSDILFPSPWNYVGKSPYDESDDVDWPHKTNALFWRGSSSDGFTFHGLWTGFQRTRLVNEGSQQPPSPSSSGLGVNVSFSGDIIKCHGGDCRAQLDTFRRWGETMRGSEDAAAPAQGDSSPLPERTPFEDSWNYRHLIDMDGAGFSGRLIPFLQSKSLVYRSALFKSWFDERLFSWHHYVPVDVRLGRGFWSLVRYLASRGDVQTMGSTVSQDAGQTGDDIAQSIARRGRAWAHKALRPDDMQVYMFRLLLEWGRIVDDDREQLGYGSPGP